MFMDVLISSAHAQAAGAQGQGSLWTTMLPLIMLFALMYFMILRPQSKRAAEHQRMVNSLQRGDEVVAAGIVGRIDELGDTYLTLEIAPNVKIKVERGALTKVLPKGTLKAL